MSTPLIDLLNSYRTDAHSNRELGNRFERLAVAFLKNDPIQVSQYDEVWTFADWAEMQGKDRRDTGIDLVARIRDTGDFCAIQCKFYDADKRIQKSEIDSFFTASGKEPFKRRLIIDTTDAEWSYHAEDALRDQQIETLRIGLSDLSASPIDWAKFQRSGAVELAPKKQALPHQAEALDAVEAGLETADRGKLLMACGTGKTFTGLIIAERLAGKGKTVLYLVPSLALMSQTVREWTNDTSLSLRSFAVCSDAQVGVRRKSEDVADLEIHDLAFPASTDARKFALEASKPEPEKMTVVFSTYQSIQSISEAQLNFGLDEFDIIICDEAHRTTGAKFDGEEESNFIKVHNQEFIRGKKRLYMTATPRIYGDQVKTKAAEATMELCSMDDVSLYGETLFQRGFSWAVQAGLLTDYKVIVLAIDEGIVSAGVQRRLTDENSELVLDDATKIIGCYKALTKSDLKIDVLTDPHPMRKALAFCKDIKSSKLITSEFSNVAREFLKSNQGDDDAIGLNVELNHVDGTYNAKSRGLLLDWLKADAGDETCRILSNARCLSEGVDVPALDAIMFLHPRKSQIDVVQSVGRVMRRAPGKKMGYVILPVAIPAGMSPEEALNNNEKFRVVWQILNALRAHDDRFEATLNKIDLGADVSGQIEIIAVSNSLPQIAAKAESAGIGSGSARGDDDEISEAAGKAKEALQTAFVFDDFAPAILAKIVKKCGRRDYWEDWAGDIAKIAQTHISRIKAVVEIPGTKEREAFDSFLGELRDDLNDSITEGEAIEMLAQHLITRPVFEALFSGYSFVNENPVSRAMQSVLDVLEDQHLEKESKPLEKFYASVKFRAEGIDNAEGKQRIVVELYDKFFRNAFPKMTEKLGIVYTPVEIVDFIIHSVNEVLQSEFGQTLGSPGVHIIDPFTGTFITQLLQSGLIAPEEMEHKFRHEIHANEIVLLAYYIAAINIEAVYHGIMGGDYVPFEGICLTDTFQMYESDDLISHYMPDNSERRKRQKATDIRVIVGNPPYSGGQDSANDNNAKVIYPSLDGRIRDTYASESKAALKAALYNSYIRAFRWASDRIGESGVMAFVSGSAWIERNYADGMRKCLSEEFSDLYVFHLRGDIRKNMLSKGAAREGQNVFASGSMTGISIAILVKNPGATEHGHIHFHDIGPDLTTAQKLTIIRNFVSIDGISKAGGWGQIAPDHKNDWIDQVDLAFDRFILIGDKRVEGEALIFEDFSNGLKTQRDAWAYNFSPAQLTANMSRMMLTYNEAIDQVGGQSIEAIKKSVDYDPKRISWSDHLFNGVKRGKRASSESGVAIRSLYRPFEHSWAYYSSQFNDRRGQLTRIFPNADAENMVIIINGKGSRNGMSAFISSVTPDLNLLEAGAQCFPLYFYEENTNGDDLFASVRTHNSDLARRDAITDVGLAHFQADHPSEIITKEDLFFYIYGLLHSPEYRTRYANNLAKGLPRIPRMKTVADFWAFSRAGRALGDLHVNYEAVERYPVTIKQGDLRLADVKNPESFYRVTKWAFGKNGKDKTTVIYNANITMQDIPLEAYDYVINGKPALEWVMERQVVKVDKESGIENDANRYAIETMNNPAYPLELFQRVITVSLRTMEIVRGLPHLNVME